MNGIQKGKTQYHEKPFPGCLGRMVNLFDLTAGAPGNQLLADKPYGDRSLMSRSCLDLSEMSPVRDCTADKMITSELRRNTSNRKSNRTPIKMLIDEEMSKEVTPGQNPPNLVARLMGLDTLPRQRHSSASQRNHARSFSHSDVPTEYWQQEHESCSCTQVQHEIRQYPEKNDLKDVHEIWQSRSNHVGDRSSKKERLEGFKSEKKMALVRQKFADLKRLSTDEKLRESKQFQDALEVLSLNKDLFLKFLQEPNSMFSQNLYDLQYIPLPSETKRITVLKPAKIVDSNEFAGSQMQFQIDKLPQCKQVSSSKKRTSEFSTPTSCKVQDSRIQATRIVVLKPSHGKSRDIKAVASPLSSLPRALDLGEPEDEDARESKELAKEITDQMREKLTRHSRDDTLLSSVFSNGYIGDESSFHKSENEYVVDNISDPEIMSPSSRHSWDYVNRSGSPYSLSSLSHASYSPESSVCREAKKRLSERWAMMASNRSCQEKRHVPRSSSTLGEMLAISDMKKSPILEEDFSQQQEARGSTSCLINYSNGKDDCDTNKRNFLRSKSVPVASTYGSKIDVKFSNPKMEKETEITKELMKTRSAKSSLKGRVSSLFFSRNKKYGEDESSQSNLITDSGVPRYSGIDGNPSEHGSDIVSSSKASALALSRVEPKQETTLTKAGFSVTKRCADETSNEHQEQPSPVSVLEHSFDEDDRSIPEFHNNLKPDGHGMELPLHPIKSNLIDKSPPIGSIARTLSWDDSCTEMVSPYSFKSSMSAVGVEEEKKEWFYLVQTLLSAADFNSEVLCDTIFFRWHSLESPLDLSLRGKFIDLTNKELQHKSKQMQMRSTQKLVFDCVNAVLMDITGSGSGSATCQRGISCRWSGDKLQDPVASTLVDRVWTEMKESFSDSVRCVFGDYEDNGSLVVERVVSKELVGKDWVEHLTIEIEDFRKEVEMNLLEELVQEAVAEFTSGM